jgi:hypothetical protein
VVERATWVSGGERENNDNNNNNHNNHKNYRRTMTTMTTTMATTTRLERLSTVRGRHHLGPEHLHAPDVGPLLADVDLPHVDLALQPDQRRGGRQRHAMLARARLGDELALAHVFSQQGLPEAVVDFVAARVVEILALQEYLRATQITRQVRAVVPARRQRQRRRWL